MGEVSLNRTDFPFLTIHKTLAEDFEQAILNCYKESAGEKEVVKIPNFLLSPDGDFSKMYNHAYGIVLESIMRHALPEAEWDKFSEEEYTRYEKILEEFPGSFGETLFFHDMELVLEWHQLFYVKTQMIFVATNNSFGEHIVSIHNSPLQEVW